MIVPVDEKAFHQHRYRYGAVIVLTTRGSKSMIKYPLVQLYEGVGICFRACDKEQRDIQTAIAVMLHRMTFLLLDMCTACHWATMFERANGISQSKTSREYDVAFETCRFRAWRSTS
eukprot:747410-Hanusia_phi.AAC.2